MKRFASLGLLVLLTGMLIAIQHFMGPRVCCFAGVFAGLWFGIATVLLARPPGMPEFVSEGPGNDEQYVIRKDVVPRLPWRERLSLALAVACGSCLLIWATLVLLAL